MIQAAFQSILVTEILFAFSVLAFLFFTGLLIRKIRADKSTFWPVLVILLVGLGLRVVWIGWTQPVPESDFQVYWDYANRFYQGDLRFDVIERHPGVTLLYTLAFFLMGASMMTGWIVNLFFSAVFLLVLYQLTRELFGNRAGLLAMGLGAVLPQLVTYAALMASEIPAVTFFLLTLWAAIRTHDLISPRWLLQSKADTTLQIHDSLYSLCYWAALGLMLYGAILIRSTSILLLGLIPFTFLFTRKGSLKPLLHGCLVMIMTTAILVSTWVAHQYVISGVPKLFFGSEIWLAFATQYDQGGSNSETSLPFREQFLAVQDGTIAGKVRGYKVLETEALKIIKADPARYLQFGFVRMKQILWGSKTGVLWTTRASNVFSGNQKTIRHLGEASTHIWRVLLVFSLLSLPWLYRSPRSGQAREGLLLISLFLAVWLVFHYLFAVASERYAFQIIPFVTMFAGGGLSLLMQKLPQWNNLTRQPA